MTTHHDKEDNGVRTTYRPIISGGGDMKPPVRPQKTTREAFPEAPVKE